MKKLTLFFRSLFCLLLFLSGQSELSAQTYENITVSEAQMLIDQNQDNAIFTILDVRTPGEYNVAHLEGAYMRNFYDSDFMQQLDSLNKDRIYLIYCQSGNRSGQAFTMMQNLGFSEVYNMLGGISAWLSAGFSVTDVIPPYIDLTADITTSTHITTTPDDIQIYPNPSVSEVVIDGDFTDYHIQILDSTGQLVRDYANVLSPLVVDLNTLGAGVYFVSIQSTVHPAVSVHKFIKR